MVCDERTGMRSFCVLHRFAGRIFALWFVFMEKPIAILGIIVSDREASAEVNRLLHEYGEHIVGRMGIPREGCSIITVVMESENDTINALSGKLGRLKNVQVKSMMAK